MCAHVLQNVLYHGTTKSFNKFDLKYCGKGTKMPLGFLGVYFTPCAELASKFCKNKWSSNRSKYRAGSNVIPVKLRDAKPFTMTALEWIGKSGNSADTLSKLRESYINNGFNCLVIKSSDIHCRNELYEPQVIVLDPSIIEFNIQ
jgi:hypothetical protein